MTKLFYNALIRHFASNPDDVPAMVSAIVSAAKDEMNPKQVQAFKELFDRVDGPVVKLAEVAVEDKRQTFELKDGEGDAGE